MKEHFIEGVGYVFYESRWYEESPGERVKKKGWWLRRTPGGKPGASFEPEFLGYNKAEASLSRLDKRLIKFFS